MHVHQDPLRDSAIPIQHRKAMVEEELKRSIRAALTEVQVPGAGADPVSSGLVTGVEANDDGEVRVLLAPPAAEAGETVRAVRRAVSRIDGVRSVRIVAAPTPSRSGDDTEEAGGKRSLPVMGQGSGGGPARGSGGEPGRQQALRDEASRHPRDADQLPGVDTIVAVSSGKGGVGKSTVATNLAAALARDGHRVGLLDADIYGPDIPKMFGVYERPRMSEEEVVPLEAHGVKLMSIGFLVDEDTPAIWRGPIIMGVVRQFLHQVRWGELDYLVVDLPPGTGDAQLSLVQLVKVAAAVMVTTPQDVAVGGVLKGIRMFEKLEVPVAGVVENMRGFVCPDCGTEHEIFGSGGGEKLAASLGLEFLGAVPLGVAVREEGDRGIPTVLGRPESPEGRAFRELARRVVSRLDELDEPHESGTASGEGGGPAVAGETPGESGADARRGATSTS